MNVLSELTLAFIGFLASVLVLVRLKVKLVAGFTEPLGHTQHVDSSPIPSLLVGNLLLL